MTENTQNTNEVFSFMIPMLQDNLLMPSETVAEIVPFMNVNLFENAENGDDWHIGNLAWRNMNIPVISLERVQGQQDLGDIRRSRIAVIYTLNGNQDLPYLAFTVQGIPRIIPVGSDNSEMLDAKPNDKGVAAWVTVAGKKAMVPDMDMMESMAKEIR
ncbi:MAG: chemotaxis protein CheW [Gammaproteobacteria bacterium]|nr:chemotaxis protein CheW [Gammaproteobacteria bacterium]